MLSGPPPHAWGLRKVKDEPSMSRRSTPTRVGTTTVRPCLQQRCAVYPHTRGDYDVWWQVAMGHAGLPPHAWGLLSLLCLLLSLFWSTPTRVGTTVFGLFTHSLVSVYPHTRGDYVTCWVICVALTGLPPHAWGLLLETVVIKKETRSTPTRVGTTDGNG